MRVMIVIEVDVPTVDEIPEVLAKIDPPSVPYFVDGVSVVPEPFASELRAWLDE